MAASGKLYSHFSEHLVKKLMDLESDTIKVMLCTSSYTPSQDNHDFKDDVDNEVSGTGYSAGGATLANQSLSLSGRVLTIDGDNTQWTSSTITARYAVIYDDEPSGDGNKPLIGYVDFGENKSSDNGTFKIQWNASGIFTMTVGA
jgi:hypothetical protein